MKIIPVWIDTEKFRDSKAFKAEQRNNIWRAFFIKFHHFTILQFKTVGGLLGFF